MHVLHLFLQFSNASIQSFSNLLLGSGTAVEQLEVGYQEPTSRSLAVTSTHCANGQLSVGNDNSVGRGQSLPLADTAINPCVIGEGSRLRVAQNALGISVLVGAIASLSDEVSRHLIESSRQIGQILSNTQCASESACPSIPAGTALLPVQTLVATLLGATLIPAIACAVERSATNSVGILLIELVRELIQAILAHLRLTRTCYEPRISHTVCEVSGILHRANLTLIVSVNGFLQTLESLLDFSRTAICDHCLILVNGCLQFGLAGIVGLVGKLLSLSDHLVKSNHIFHGLLILLNGILDVLQELACFLHVVGVNLVVECHINFLYLVSKTLIVGHFVTNVAKLLQIVQAVLNQDVNLVSITDLDQLDTVDAKEGVRTRATARLKTKLH